MKCYEQRLTQHQIDMLRLLETGKYRYVELAPEEPLFSSNFKDCTKERAIELICNPGLGRWHILPEPVLTVVTRQAQLLIAEAKTHGFVMTVQINGVEVTP